MQGRNIDRCSVMFTLKGEEKRVNVEYNITYSHLRNKIKTEFHVENEDFEIYDNSDNPLLVRFDHDVKAVLQSSSKTFNIALKDRAKREDLFNVVGRRNNTSRKNSDIVATEYKIDIPNDVDIRHLFNQAGFKMALFIGNDNYEHHDNLCASVSDVSVLESLFKGMSFTTFCSANDSMEELISDVESVKKILEQSEDAYIAVFVSGHGFIEKGITYFMPTDCPPLAMANSVDFTEKCVSIDYICEQLDICSPALLFIMVDVCRTRIDHHNKQWKARNHYTTSKCNRVMLYAASEGEQAFNDVQTKRGYFLTVLQEFVTNNISVHELVSKLKQADESIDVVLELRNNKLSLTDPIVPHCKFFTTFINQWLQVVRLGPLVLQLKDIGVKVYIEFFFVGDFSNILRIEVRLYPFHLKHLVKVELSSCHHLENFEKEGFMCFTTRTPFKGSFKFSYTIEGQPFYGKQSLQIESIKDSLKILKMLSKFQDEALPQPILPVACSKF